MQAEIGLAKNYFSLTNEPGSSEAQKAMRHQVCNYIGNTKHNTKDKSMQYKLFLYYAELYTHFDWYYLLSLSSLFLLSFIKQIDSMLPFVCSVIDHR